MSTHEVNFDGLVGPTHNYSGLSLDNLACRKNVGNASSPRQAALEGLEKMKLLADMDLKQAFLPPHPRPDLNLLKDIGFTGDTASLLTQARENSPEMLRSANSAAAMWTANAATIAPSTDTTDGKCNITPANLIAEIHRSIEAPWTHRILTELFKDNQFTVHPPLPNTSHLSDEGAANHTRFAPSHSHKGLHLFVYGRSAFDKSSLLSEHFIPRHTLEASQAIARLHAIDPKYTLFAQQNPDAIDAGAFHNDVVSVGNLNTFLYHEEAFLDTPHVIESLKERFQSLYDEKLYAYEVSANQVSLEETVNTYLFNSQVLSMPSGAMALIAPLECQESDSVRQTIDTLIASDGPINEVHYLDVRQSMMNGGGPACLRLRVPLSESELNAIPQNIFINDVSYEFLKSWINKHYRDSLSPEELSDPALFEESEAAIKELLDFLQINP